MPLPPALAARLAKRGIPIPQNEQHVEPTEEIIAEDYDETAPINPSKDIHNNTYISAEKDYEFDLDINFKIKGYENCPNKYNIYHDCSHYCVKKWKNGAEPDVKYLERKMRMLMKYPLPDNWKEVYDRGIGRHYYWDTSNDLVSWLPPGHPKAVITECASALREERLMKEGDESDDSGAGSSEEESTVAKYDSKRDEKHPSREFKRPHPPQFESKFSKRARQQERTKSAPLDPMDPSSYSDVPRGNWASGLENQSEAKTGVDTTASGSLYQMRPYPSPGAILSANSKSKPPEDNGKKSIMYPQLPDEDDD